METAEIIYVRGDKNTKFLGFKNVLTLEEIRNVLGDEGYREYLDIKRMNENDRAIFSNDEKDSIVLVCRTRIYSLDSSYNSINGREYKIGKVYENKVFSHFLFMTRNAGIRFAHIHKNLDFLGKKESVWKI